MEPRSADNIQGEAEPTLSEKITSFGQLAMLCLMHPKKQFARLAARVHCCLILNLLSTVLLYLLCVSHVLY